MTIRSTITVGIIAAAMLALPFAALAQETDLKASVRQAILNDPRAAGMTDAQINAMVDTLSEGAKEQGITSQDLVWRPAPTDNMQPVCTLPSLLCAMNNAFGFDGSNPLIPTLLGVLAAILLFVIGVMLERHYVHTHPRATASYVPPVAPQNPPLQ